MPRYPLAYPRKCPKNKNVCYTTIIVLKACVAKETHDRRCTTKQVGMFECLKLRLKKHSVNPCYFQHDNLRFYLTSKDTKLDSNYLKCLSFQVLFLLSRIFAQLTHQQRKYSKNGSVGIILSCFFVDTGSRFANVLTFYELRNLVFMRVCCNRWKAFCELTHIM